MNQKLPKPMLDALARGARPVEHPSADVLAGFVERTLAEDETLSVTEHLAGCGECRDVVFLASSAAEEPVAQEEGLLVAAAARGPQMWAATAHAAAGAQTPTSPPKRGPRWTPRLVWATSLSAVALVVGGYVMTLRVRTAPVVREMAGMKAEDASPLEAEQWKDVTPAPPAATMTSPAPVAKARPAAAPTAMPRTKPAQPLSSDMVAMNGSLAPAANNELDAKAEAPKPAQGGPVISIGGALAGAGPATPRANGFAAAKGEAAAQARAMNSLGVAMENSVPSTMHRGHPDWRITAEGELEHLGSEGWTRVLADETRAFRAIAVIGNQVWAGGDGGALFHSSDGGAHWSNVALTDANGSETAAIVTIRFSDAQHGLVIKESGQIYSTSDGGARWTKP